MPNKNIWLICKYATPHKYFFGTRHFSLSKHWVKLGYKVHIFTSNSSHLTDSLPKFKGWYFTEFIDEIKTTWINLLSSNKSNGINRIISWVLFEFKLLLFNKNKESSPDIIIVSSLSLLSIWSGIFFSWKYNAKFILEIRDIWPKSLLVLGNYSKYNPFILFLSLTERLGYKFAYKIVGTMPNLVEHVKKINNKYASKVICIPQCYDEEFYNNKQNKISNNYMNELNNESFKVCYIGTMNKNNPIEALLQSAINQDFEVIILGRGSQKEMLKKKYSIYSNIKFLDSINKNQVNDFLSYVDICYDSIDTELGKYGLSRNKWIDYMMAGKPILCSYNGFQSMINEAKSGYFVPFSDIDMLRKKIYKLKNDKKLLLELGKNATEWINLNRSSKTISELYSILF